MALTKALRSKILREQTEQAEEMVYRTGIDIDRFTAALEATPGNEEVEELLEQAKDQHAQWEKVEAAFKRRLATQKG